MTPTGAIKTNVPGGIGTTKWEDITRYDDAIHAAADPLAWPIERIRAHIIIESRGNKDAKQTNFSNGDSYGLMQVVPYGVGWDGWSALVKEKAGLPKNASKQKVIDALKNPAVNIAVGTQILENFYQQYNKSADKASSAFFLGNPNWTGGDTVNGTSGADYKRALDGLMAEQKAFAPVDPIRVIVGGDYPPIDYGWLADAGLHYYAYGVGHGTQRDTQHTGYDVGVPLGTHLFTPISGVVDCVGGRGTPRWGQGCGAYADEITGGVGNITIFGDSGHKLTLGHCNKSLVAPGQRVTAGQQVGTSGGMNGPHVHVETSVNRNGTYWLLDPGPALKDAMSGTTVPVPVTFPDPLPVPQADDFDVSVPVTVLEDGVPVLQRAAMDAPRTKPDLKKGDTFDAVYQVLGNDKHIYWITTLGNRVPVEHTSASNWTGFGGTQPVDLGPVIDEVESIRADTDKRLRAVIASLG